MLLIQNLGKELNELIKGLSINNIPKELEEDNITLEIITERIKSIQNRKELTDVWKDGGITESKEYAILTNEIYQEWSGMKANEYKEFKGLRKESLRDNMTRIEELLTDLGEEATKELAKEHKPKGLEQNKKIARLGGHAAKSARDDLEKNLGKTVITSKNNVSYKYINEKEKIENGNKI